LGGQEGSDTPDKFSLGIAIFLFSAGLWLMWSGWRAAKAERQVLAVTHNGVPAANSAMLIVTILFILLIIWALRLH
jgi:hypothetical protein